MTQYGASAGVRWLGRCRLIDRTFVILLILWLLGFLGLVGGVLIHVLLVIAVIVLVINLIQGRRPLYALDASRHCESEFHYLHD